MSGFIALLQGALSSIRMWVVVAPWEQGLRVRFGKRAKLLRSGFHWTLPFVDRVHRVSVRVRMIADNGLTVMSKDGKPVTINLAMQFSVRDALCLFNEVANPEATIVMRAAAGAAKYIANTPLSEITHDAVERAARVSVPETWGLSDVDVRVLSFASVRTYRIMQHEYRSLSGLDEQLMDRQG